MKSARRERRTCPFVRWRTVIGKHWHVRFAVRGVPTISVRTRRGEPRGNLRTTSQYSIGTQRRGSVNTSTIAAAEILPANPLISAALWDPPERAPYLQAEVTAFCELSKILADDPRVALRRFLETALRMCKAGSAGVSLLRPSETGPATVHWEAISGALASHEGSDATRDFSPCGL